MKKVSQFESPDQSPGFLLWQVSMAWRRKIESALLALDLTHPQFVLLANVGYLTRDRRDVTQVELAKHCRTDITMTSQVLRTLESKGYIERKRRTGDERSKLPRLTRQGTRLVEKALPLVESIDRAFFGKLKKGTKPCVDILRQLAS